MKIGLVVNPWAGVGGAVALKGSDGSAIRTEALKRGAVPRANEKTGHMLHAFLSHSKPDNSVQWFCAPADMGEHALLHAGILSQEITVHSRINVEQTEAEHTQLTMKWFKAMAVDIVVFAGGDGTARDVCSELGTLIPVIGVPAGVKIHSGVFAVTAHAAGEVLAGLVNGSITELHTEEVRDIDEDAFRDNRVASKYYGEMNIPVAGEFMQHVKVGGIESDELVLNDISEWLESRLEKNVCYFIGSGKTTESLMTYLQLPNTLLGVDAFMNGQVIKGDCTDSDLLKFLEVHPCKAILSIIGGQGHIFGRGNAQFSPAVIKTLGKDNVWIIGSKNKLKSLEGRSLLVDTTIPELDQEWAGLIAVITGYNDTVIYPVAAL
jgi:predicted polyphosphate/ATP-dependent NAD kinase